MSVKYTPEGTTGAQRTIVEWRAARQNRGASHLIALALHNVIVIMLGEFEYLLLSAASHLGNDAYGAAIRLQIQNSIGRGCSIGALYTTLDRLEAKGLIETWMGDATPERGGRPKRMVRVTAKGVHEAAAFYAAVVRATRDVPWQTQERLLRP